MTDHFKHTQAGADTATACRIRMHLGRVCGRPIQSPWVSDNPPVYLMHSHQPGKSDADFEKAIEEIFKAAEANLASGGERALADFTKFIFPAANYRNRKIYVRCVFNEAIFTDDTKFNNVAFYGHVSFMSTTFAKAADFGETTFAGPVEFDRAAFNGLTNFKSASIEQYGSFMQTAFDQADFEDAKFVEDAKFSCATFACEAIFIGARFARHASFLAVAFKGGANFFGALFAQEADFGETRFEQRANFSGTTFTERADFHRAKFGQHASFSRAAFTQLADFHLAVFTKAADFSITTFNCDANYNEATFVREADFRWAKFLASAEFRETEFRGTEFKNPELREAALHDDKIQPGPIFSLAQFFQPEKVIFYRTNLGRALFYNCEVSEVKFYSVTWGRRIGSRKWMLFEEKIKLNLQEVEHNHQAVRDLLPKTDSPNKCNYLLIAETYRQLKKNYDDRTDYGTAGDFHYGEMEMRRLDSWRRKKPIRWLHQHLRLVALYKYASHYGESYVRPLLCLAGVLLFFTLALPFAGLEKTQPPSSSVVLLSESYCDFVHRHPDPTGISRVALFTGYTWRTTFWDSAMTTLSVAGFQKELKYTPSYPWGRALALLELLLTSTLIALFLLALRRQFKR